MVIAFAVLPFRAIYFSEVHNFYCRIPHWDTMLHIFSGAAQGAIATPSMATGTSSIVLIFPSQTAP